ncbi:MAG: prepilin-type N-terminal cleavage/methylation domain-containing protein [Fibrobacterales bacterium]
MNRGIGQYSSSQRGVTLIELMAAIAVSAIVLTLLGQLFLQSQKEYSSRMSESWQFQKQYLIEKTINKALYSDFEECSFGKIKVKTLKSTVNESIYQKFPEVEAITFKCFELDPDLGIVQDWKFAIKPDLVKYQIQFVKGVAVDGMVLVVR